MYHVTEVTRSVRRKRVIATRPEDIACVVREHLVVCAQESMWCVLLDCKHHVIGVHMVTQGTASQAIINPRDMLQRAITGNAVNVVIVHNHPSGNPTPSHEDVAFTDRMIVACNLVGITLLDHVVLGSADTGDVAWHSIRASHPQVWQNRKGV